MMSSQQPQPVPRKPYQPPAIVYRGILQAQAGSPLGVDPLHDLLQATPGSSR